MIALPRIEVARTGSVRVNTYRARDGSERPIELAFDMFGERGEPLVLIMGIGAQRMFWDDDFCGLLVAAGFRVVRIDNRDVGHSTHLDAAAPAPYGQLVRRMTGLAVNAPYTLSDMARDVVGLVDALELGPIHVVGASLGGMVAQHLAIEHPRHLRTMTSIMSSPGARRYIPEPRAMGALLGKPPKTLEEAGASIERVFMTIGDNVWGVDRSRLRAHGEEAFRRGLNPRGFLRQFSAVLASGDRRAQLPSVRAPTLVIHGSRDPLFALAAGRETAALIPGATFLPIAGMAHYLPTPLWPTLTSAIARHARRASENR